VLGAKGSDLGVADAVLDEPLLAPTSGSGSMGGIRADGKTLGWNNIGGGTNGRRSPAVGTLVTNPIRGGMKMKRMAKGVRESTGLVHHLRLMPLVDPSPPIGIVLQVFPHNPTCI